VFADGAVLDGIREMAENPLIKGFTTNPTLMRKDGVSDYKGFALDMLKIVNDRPVSFEVFAVEFDEMEAQAL
jgi:transaldolase